MGFDQPNYMAAASMPTAAPPQTHLPTAALPTNPASSPTYGGPPTYTGPPQSNAASGHSQLATEMAPRYDGYGGMQQQSLGTTPMADYRPPQTRIPSSSAIIRDARRPTDLEVEIPPGVEAG